MSNQFFIDLDHCNDDDNDWKLWVRFHLPVLSVQLLGLSPNGHTEYRITGTKEHLLKYLELWFDEDEDFFNEYAEQL